MSEKEIEAVKVQEKQTYGRHQLIVFRQGTEEYALHIDQIKEVVITPTVTKMPQTPEYIRGVANIRGNIIAIVDLEEKFGIRKKGEDASNDRKNYTLVIESDEMKIGILVKDVPNTLTVSDKDIDEGVNVVTDTTSDKNYIKGIVKIESRLVILIDIFKVMSRSELSSLSSHAA